jgi:glycosyltransferase involved in cell wall biosynthesis
VNSISLDKPEHLATSLTVVGFTAYPWEHILPVLRLSEPLRLAGIELIHGNSMEEIEPERVSQADLVVIQRDFPRWESAYRQIVSLARAEGKLIIYEADDLLLELPENHPDRSINYYSRALLPMLRAILEADVVTASTRVLYDYLRPFNSNIWLLPNYLMDQIWPLHPPEEKFAGQDAAAPIVVGYMGTTSHTADLEVLSGVLRDLLEQYGDKIALRFWGIQPPSEVRGLHNVEWIPLHLLSYTQFVEYFAAQTCDIFFAPLSDSHFNQSKSPLKFLEYSALGVPGVYSHIAPYETVVNHGENGLLASTASDWAGCLRQLIDNPALRFRMGIQAYQTVTQNWRLSKHAHEWREVYLKAEEHARQIHPDDQQRRRTFAGMLPQLQEWQETLENQGVQDGKTIRVLQLENAEKETEKELLLHQSEQDNQTIRVLQLDNAEKETEKELLLSQIEQDNQTIRVLQLENAEKELLLQQNNQSIQDLRQRYDALYYSRAGRLTRALWRLRVALLPPGTRRERAWNILTHKKQPKLE